MRIPLLLGIIMLATVGVVGMYIITTVIASPGSSPTNSPNSTTPQIAQEYQTIHTNPSPVPSIDVHKEAFSLKEQAVVIYHPEGLTVQEDIPRALIIYSHGSNEHVDPARISQQFVQELDRYGNYFASKGALFIASEMYGENWGSRQAREHILHLIEHTSANYIKEPIVILYGYSMGGLPTLRFAKDYPSMVDLILLLAPTIAMDDWTPQAVNSISSIPIRIWHGTRDVNVPHSLSNTFIDRATDYGHTNATLVSVPDEIHRHFVEPERLWQEIEPLIIR